MVKEEKDPVGVGALDVHLYASRTDVRRFCLRFCRSQQNSGFIENTECVGHPTGQTENEIEFISFHIEKYNFSVL